MTSEDWDLWIWFEQGKQMPSPEKQYNYFSEGFRKGERYHPWAWIGIGLVWLQKGNVESAISAFEKVLAMDPDLPGIAQQLQLVREKLMVQPAPREVPDDTPGGYLEHLITCSTTYRIRDLRFPWREITLEDALSRPGFIKWIEWNREGVLSDNGITIGYCAYGQQFAFNRVTHEIALGDVTFWGIGWSGDITG